jgi:hypothetical protein
VKKFIPVFPKFHSKPSSRATRIAVIAALCTTVQFGYIAPAAEPSKPVSVAASGETEDKIVATATMDPKLDTPFFHKIETSFPWHVVVHEDGSLEDTTDGSIDADDLRRIEHTAHCISSHQGEHIMEFSDASARNGGVKLIISIDASLRYECTFQARYPSATPTLNWKISKKELRLKSDKMKPGSRLCGWISVEFEETDSATAAARTHKIEGHFKPVIQGAAANR